MPEIVKNKINNQTHSKYADLTQIKRVVDPLLAKYGFFDRYEDVMHEDGRITTTCIITHELGHSIRNSVTLDLDNKGIKGTVNKTSIHASASTMTYGQRLALCRALGLRIAEDTDGNSVYDTITDEQAKELKDLLKETGADVKKFLAYMKVDCVDNIYAKDYPRAYKLLMRKKNDTKGTEKNTKVQ